MCEALELNRDKVDYIIKGKGKGDRQVRDTIMLAGFGLEMYYDGIVTLNEVIVS